MKGVFRYINPASLITLLGSILISYIYLISIGISDLATMIQTLFGGKPLNGILLKSLFVLTVLLLQFTLIDYVSFYIDNFNTLFVRYGNKMNWLIALLRGALIISAAFVIFSYFIALLSYIVSSGFIEISIISRNIIEIIGKTYLFCVIIGLIQIYLLLIFTKTNAFMIMGGITIFLALTNQSHISFLYILPRFSSPMITILNIFESIVLVFVLVSLIKTNILKKELEYHEN